MRLLGGDPNCLDNHCPTVWEDGDTYVIQGWRVTDAATLTEVGEVPAGETLIRLPKRMAPLFAEASGTGG